MIGATGFDFIIFFLIVFLMGVAVGYGWVYVIFWGKIIDDGNIITFKKNITKEVKK